MYNTKVRYVVKGRCFSPVAPKKERELLKKAARRSVTVLLVPHGIGRVRQWNMHRSLFVGLALALVVAGGGLAYLIQDYMEVRRTASSITTLEQVNRVQQQKIQELMCQVEEFDRNLEKLEKLEDKLRVLAGVGDPGTAAGGLGQGGPEEDAGEEADVQAKGAVSADMVSLDGLGNRVQELQRCVDAHFEQLGTLERRLAEQQDLFAATPNIFPCSGWISSGFGWRINPFTRKREFHRAIDIASSWGNEVKAAACGVVRYAGWQDGYGLVVKVDDGYGYETVYGHLSKILVKKGDQVNKGQVIGRIGSTGRSTGPHLHFEVWRNGESMNPLNLMVEPLS